jgi:hypothetical protein
MSNRSQNIKPVNMQRINNFRMGAYAALAVGLINLRYQSGSDNNLFKSLALVAPGALVLALSFSERGRGLLMTKTATALGITVGFLALAYSFLV